MKAEVTAKDRTLCQNCGERSSQAREAQRTFAVLSVTSCKVPLSPSAIMDRCGRIPGVSALRVDADRGKIHVLYDGNLPAIEQIGHALLMLGHRIRTPGELPASRRRTRVAENPHECPSDLS